MTELERLRSEIDGVDEEIVALFEKRMELAGKVADYKRENDLPVYHPGREAEVLKNRVALLKQPRYAGYVRELFSYLMAASRREQSARNGSDFSGVSPAEIGTFLKSFGVDTWETALKKKPRVAYQGTAGSYSEAAVKGFFHEKISKSMAFPLWPDVFDAVESGSCDYGVLPIENSSTGGISDVMSLLTRRSCFVVGEYKLKVEHCLLGVPGAELSDVRRVCSHEQALMQCSEFLLTLPDVEAQASPNTALSAQEVAQAGNRELCCIASKSAAQLYGLTVLKENIGNTGNNHTRFAVIARHPILNEDCGKISLALTIEHRSGSLYHILSNFASSGLNLTKIESRPVLGSDFEYLFYIDVLGNLRDEAVQAVLSCVKDEAKEFHFLGNYPAAL